MKKSLVSQYLLDGAGDFIVKPFNLDEVAARVTVQLRGVSGPSLNLWETTIKNIADTFEIATVTSPCG